MAAWVRDHGHYEGVCINSCLISFCPRPCQWAVRKKASNPTSASRWTLRPSHAAWIRPHHRNQAQDPWPHQTMCGRGAIGSLTLTCPLNFFADSCMGSGIREFSTIPRVFMQLGHTFIPFPPSVVEPLLAMALGQSQSCLVEDVSLVEPEASPVLRGPTPATASVRFGPTRMRNGSAATMPIFVHDPRSFRRRPRRRSGR